MTATAKLSISEGWMANNAIASADEHAMMDYLMGVQAKNGGEAFLAGEALLTDPHQLAEGTRFCISGSIHPLTQYADEGPIQCVVFTVLPERMKGVTAILRAHDNLGLDEVIADDGPDSPTHSSDADTPEPFQVCMELADAQKFLLSAPSPNRPVVN